jgi:hypothetical protein
VAAMPTVLDCLRRQLLGDDAANKLELSLDILSARIFGRSQQKIHVNRNHSRSDIEFVELAKPSPGYEPLLMKMGWNQFAARGLAKFVVRRAKLRAKESKLYRQVTKDIRILAKGPRQRAAFIRCAQRLRNIWEVTPFVGELLYKANVDDFEFMRLLKLAAEGHRNEFNRVKEIAAKVAPQLSIKRGPKIGAASAAHESFLKDEFRLGLGPWPKPQQDRAAEYVDALTAATRGEFKISDFDPRPAQRRIIRKRLNSLEK